MLLGENGGGNENGNLAAIHDCFEGGADTDFSLTKAHITADEAVHWLGTFHVSLCFENRPHLIGGFLEQEGAFKLALPRDVRGKGVSGLRITRRLDGQQITRDVAHGAFGLSLGFGPAGGAQSVERRPSLACADVLAD